LEIREYGNNLKAETVMKITGFSLMEGMNNPEKTLFIVFPK